MDVSSETDIISEIRRAILRRLGYVERMPDDRTVKKSVDKYPRRKKVHLESQEIY